MLRIKARDHRDLVTAVGHAVMLSADEWITASVVWLNDRNHGLQFKAHFLKSSAPSTVDEIEKYLGFGKIRVRVAKRMTEDEVMASQDTLNSHDGTSRNRSC